MHPHVTAVQLDSDLGISEYYDPGRVAFDIPARAGQKLSSSPTCLLNRNKKSRRTLKSQTTSFVRSIILFRVTTWGYVTSFFKCLLISINALLVGFNLKVLSHHICPYCFQISIRFPYCLQLRLGYQFIIQCHQHASPQTNR